VNLSSRQQLSTGPVAVFCAEGNFSHAITSVQNPAADNVKCSSATSSLLQMTEDITPEAAGEGDGQHCLFINLPSVELQSFPSVHGETENKQLPVVISGAAEVVDCSLNTSRKLYTNTVKQRRLLREGVDNKKENNCISEHHRSVVCEDDLSPFFGSPVSVFSLSAKLKAIPRRKAVSIDKVMSDRDLVPDEHELNSTMNCIELPRQCVLPLHNALSTNFDKLSVFAHVATTEQNVIEDTVVGQSSSIQLSLPISATNQCHFDLVHLLADMNDDAPGLLQSSDCLILPASVSVVPYSSVSLVFPLQEHTSSSCFKSSYSACDQLPLGISSSASVIDKSSGNDTSRLVSTLSQPRVKCCGGYSEKPLQKLVKHNCANKQRFVYPPTAQLCHSRVSNLIEHTSNDNSLFAAKRSKSLLHSCPDVLQSGCIMAHSEAEEHVKKVVSLATSTINNEYSSEIKEETVEGYDDNAELLLTSQPYNSLLTASNSVSSGFNSIAVTSCMNTMCDIEDVNISATYAVCSSMQESAVIETYCYSAKKMLSQDVSTESLSASLPSLINVVCCSKLMHDFAGQTSPRISSRMTLCDVGVQASLAKPASVHTSNLKKQTLFVDAAVQTPSVSCTHCTGTCNDFSQLHKSGHYGSGSQKRALSRNELWPDRESHDTVCMTNVSDMNCNLLVPVMDVLSVSNTDTYNEGASPADAVVDHILEVPQRVVSNESSVNCFPAKFLSSVDRGKLHAAECETVSAGRNLDSLKTVTDNYAQVMSDISLKNTSTGFTSAGGKPLNVKLSSKLNACKLLRNLACTTSDSLKNVVDTAHVCYADFSSSSTYNIKQVEDLSRIERTASGLMDIGNDNDLDGHSINVSLNQSSRGRNQQQMNLGDPTQRAFSLSMRNMSSESSCDMHGVCSKSSPFLTNTCEFRSANKNLISACIATHQQVVLSPEQSLTDRVADIMLPTAKQFSGNVRTVNVCTAKAHGDVNADYSLLEKSQSNDMMSNGFKPFKAPRSMVRSSEHVKKLTTANDNEHLPNTSVVQYCNPTSEDQVKIIDETELLCNLTNAQRAEVVDASLLTLNSVEALAVNELAAEQLVSTNSAAVNISAPDSINEQASNFNMSTNCDSVPKCFSSVCMLLGANTENTCEHLLTGQVQHTYDEADAQTDNLSINRLKSVTCPSVVYSDSGVCIEKAELGLIHNMEQNYAVCSLSAAGSVALIQEGDFTDVPQCCNMDSETEPVPTVCLHSCYDGETDTDQVACCKICSCVSNNASCKCPVENRNASESSEQTSADFVGKSSTKHLYDGHISPVISDKCCFQNTSVIEANVKEKPVEIDKLTHNNNPFVFFSAKGSEINVSEKLLHSIRQKWSNHFSEANDVGMENRTVMKVADADEQVTNFYRSPDFILKTNGEEMHASSIASETTEDEAVTKSYENDNKNMNANDMHETTLMSLCETSMHTTDVQSTSVMGKKVTVPNMKSIYTVSDDADVFSGCFAVSADTSYGSHLNTNVHVSYAKPAEHRLPFMANNLRSDAEEGGDKGLTDRTVVTPLCTVPESKCDLLFWLLCISFFKSNFTCAFTVLHHDICGMPVMSEWLNKLLPSHIPFLLVFLLCGTLGESFAAVLCLFVTHYSTLLSQLK